MRSDVRVRSNFAALLRTFVDIALADEAAFAHRGDWDHTFRNRIGGAFDGRIVLEIGCADANYLTRIAATHPTTAFIGLDWKYKLLCDGAHGIQAAALRNVLLLRGRAQDIQRMFVVREVDEIWLLHPEPCDRAAELQNRLMGEPFLRDVHALLRDETSRFVMKTDHAGYFQWSLALLGNRWPDEVDQDAALQLSRTVAKTLLPVAALPPASEWAKAHMSVASRSNDFWSDHVALARAADRLFAQHVTNFEARFIRKRQPIFYLELSPRTGNGNID